MKSIHFIPAKLKVDNVIKFSNISEFLNPLQTIKIVPFLEEYKELQKA